MDKMQKNINEKIYTERLCLNPEWKMENDIRFRKEIHEAGEFELYFGPKETPERLLEISINEKLYYSIYENETKEYIGYLGIRYNPVFWEPQIYIFKEYK